MGARAAGPAKTGRPRRAHEPPKGRSPLRTGPHAGDPVRSPSRALAGCGIRPSGGGSGPRGHAHKGRLPRGGSPRESGYQDWPAANDPQTPSVPGTKGPPGFGHPSDVGLPGIFKHGTNDIGAGVRRMSRGSRARPLLDAPNTVDSLDDPAKDARAGRSRVETTAGMGDCPRKKWPAQSSHATRGDAALAFHIEPPTSTGPPSCVQTFPGPDLAGGGPILALGHSGRLARARKAGPGQRRPPSGLSPGARAAPSACLLAPPRAPANWSPPRARPARRCEAGARDRPITVGPRAGPAALLRVRRWRADRYR
ncbi:hypothetical protein CNMCM7691_007114 [Aspergillus felis]|uniref:Uncharacterized protein n=1 Tax=Aspergillus felis TaxID=1287682 RepID=A0A8H6R5P6_9EURO|nr:hypothetical protein CNMCM7691_007114 [Aspergillus felis]